MKVYFISGIAADSRLFRRIQLPAGMEEIHLAWIKPLPNEPLSEYALRLARKMDTSKPFILIGTSLGGMVATEIALHHPPLALIIISSVPVFTQLPGYYHLLAKLRIHKVLPGNFYKFSGRARHYFSSENAEDKKVIMQMISETDPAFIRWGINAVLHWRNEKTPGVYFHIHGTRDELFPYRLTSPTHIIAKGDHSIVINRPDEINHVLREICNTLAIS